MSTKQLLDRWSENNDRLHWVKANRAELEAATGCDIPGRLHELEDWLTTHKAVVTRKLREAADGDDADAEAEEEPTDQTADVTEDNE